MPDDLMRLVELSGSLHETLATCHPSLRRGRVWCRSCGHAERVDSAHCLRYGWPTCCGETMTIDNPAALRAKEGEK